MKNIAFLLLIGTVFILASCSQNTNVNTLLENPETKDQVFSSILEDHNLMTEFMGKMMGHNHAKMMMQGDEDMMKMMMEGGKMTHSMMETMMKDGEMMTHMMEMMHEQGMMSEECKQSCMKMMENKGMIMDEGGTADEHDHDSNN